MIENIHAGEPLRKSAVVATGNPQAINRLSLVMTDPDKVAIVLPVDAKTAPSQIAPGDWVDLVVGLAPGNISAGNSSTFANLLTPPTAVSPVISFVPTAPASAARRRGRWKARHDFRRSPTGIACTRRRGAGTHCAVCAMAIL